jgi:tetratricopeptide (TPR) repeat protein
MFKVLLGFILPVFILLILFSYKFIFGFAGLIIYLGIVIATGRATIYSMIGNIRYTNGGPAEALKWYEKAYKTHRAGIKMEISYGYLLLKSSRIDEAEKIFTKLLEGKQQVQDEKSIKSNLALLLWKKGDLDSAIAMLEDVMEDYKTSTLYGSLGYFYIAKGDFEKALEFNLEATEYNRTNTIILDNLGLTYYMLEQSDKSLETYQKLIGMKPTFPEAYYNYGQLLLKLNRPDEALEMFRKARQCKISFLSTITTEDIESTIEKLESDTSKSE